MSLTSLLRTSPVREVFEQAVTVPNARPKLPLLAAPRTRNYQRVGTAFDYLLRFHLERINPRAHTARWIAELAIEQIQPDIGSPFSPEIFENPDYDEQIKLASTCLKAARRHHRNYLRTGKATRELLATVMRLATLDVVYRAGASRVDWTSMKDVDPRDIDDLAALLEVAQTVNNFSAERTCVLNPCFGLASQLVGGADADLIIDSRLIEVKTTKSLRLNRGDIFQLVGYYVLLLLGGVSTYRSGSNEAKEVLYAEHLSEIEELAIYFSRFGHLHRYRVAELISPDALEVLAVRLVAASCRSKRDRRRYWEQFKGALAKKFRRRTQ